MKNIPRSGFTLTQLLVILVILALLLGLLLPAVYKVRQAAGRTQSANNMKQLGLAVHNYLDTIGNMPSGNDENNFSATAYLLPYIEQDNLYKSIDFKKPVTDEANAPARKTMLKILLSPNDPRMAVTDESAATNYLFNAGSKASLDDNDGIFFQNSKIKIGDITDGTSNTLMTGETLKGDGARQATDVRRQHVRLKKGALGDLNDDSGVKDFKDNKNIVADRCASWLDGRFLQGTFTGTRALNDERPDVSCDGAGGLSALRSMPNIPVNIGMTDGSVRTINNQVKLEILKLLSGRNDGQVIPDF